MDRIALISDVHGNLTALNAVLDDIAERGIETIFNLGDYVGKGPRGADCVDLCNKACEVNIRGNWDDFIPDQTGHDTSEALRWWHAELRPDQLTWLKELPLAYDFTMSGRRIRLFHASATSVHHRVRFSDMPEAFDDMFASTELTGDGPTPSMIAYGDLHDAWSITEGGRTIINVGSVGNALDEPTPVYVILEGNLGSDEPGLFSTQFVRVPYDVEAELAMARDLRMPEYPFYEIELRRGIYRGTARELGLV